MCLLSQVTFACLRCSDKSYLIQVLSKSSMWEHVFIKKMDPKFGLVWTSTGRKKGIENSLVFKRLFRSPSCNHRLNKTGLQPVLRPVEKILGFFQEVLTSTLNLPYHLKFIKEYIDLYPTYLKATQPPRDLRTHQVSLKFTRLA